MNADRLPDADHHALVRLVGELTWRIDHGRNGVLYELWTDDGEMRYEGNLIAKGRDAIRKFGEARQANLPEGMRHLAVNLHFEPDGPRRATGSGIEVVFHHDPPFGPGAATPDTVGEWAFRCAYSDEEGWLFASMDFHKLFGNREGPLPGTIKTS